MLKKYSIKKQSAGIKALPVNFKGKFSGFAFSILNQFDIYGKVAAEFYDTAADKFLFALDGSPASVDIAIENLYRNVLGGTNQRFDDRDRIKLKKDIAKFLKQVNSEVKNYNSVKKIPAAKKSDEDFKTVVTHKKNIVKKIHPVSMARKKRSAAKKVARKKHHTVSGRVKAYRRKATVKEHTRLVAGIDKMSFGNGVKLKYANYFKGDTDRFIIMDGSKKHLDGEPFFYDRASEIAAALSAVKAKRKSSNKISGNNYQIGSHQIYIIRDNLEKELNSSISHLEILKLKKRNKELTDPFHKQLFARLPRYIQSLRKQLAAQNKLINQSLR